MAYVLPILVPPAAGQPVLLSGGAWEARGVAIAVDPSASSVRLVNGTLLGPALGAAPSAEAPLKLLTNNYTGAFELTNVLVLLECQQLELFERLACDTQPADWISADGASVNIRSFVPAPPLGGKFALTNVTLACNATTAGAVGFAPARTPACLTATVSTDDQLLSLLRYDTAAWAAAAHTSDGLVPASPAQLPTLSPSHLHVLMAANISLNATKWRVAPPQLVRPLTTLSGDCRLWPAPGGHVTALDLQGGRGLVAARRGGQLRLLCLELANLAPNTAAMPRGVLTGAVWAVDVDQDGGSLLRVDNCTMVMTKDEFVWQSYYMAQVLASTVVGSGVFKVLSSFEGTMSSTELRWSRAISPRTQWRETVLTSAPSVFPNTQPNSFVLKYLGLTLYLTNLVLVSNCTGLLAAVRGASEERPAVVLTASVSLAACWPAGGVEVPPVPSLYLMGLPDQLIRLDLAGREDAFQLSSVTMVSIRFLTLTGLPTHLADLGSGAADGEDSHDAGTAIQPTTSTSGGAATSSANGAITYPSLDAAGDGGLQFPALATTLLWSFHFARLVTQLQVEHVRLVLPEAELRQYGAMLNGSSILPYFSQLRSFFQGARTGADDNSTSPANATDGSASSNPAAVTNTSSPAQLWFANLLLPGMRVLNATLVSEAGAYPGWNESMYAAPVAPAPSDTAGWPAWQIAVVSAALGCAALLAAGGALLYARARRSRGRDLDGKAAVLGNGKQRRSHDLESGGGGRGGANAGRCSARRGSASSNPSTSGAMVAAANNGRRGGGGAGVAGTGNAAELRVASVGAARAGGGGGGAAAGAAGGDGFERHPLYDSFDDPAFELDFLKGAKKLSPDDVNDVLERINREAIEFNITMTEICGSGSFGVVYGGLWNGIKVAIKTMVFSEAAGGASQLAGQAARQQCIKEAAFCCTMHHANVVATHHFYLKSANRASMFDDLLQAVEKHLDDSSSEDGDAYRAVHVGKGTEQQEEATMLSMPPPRGALLRPHTSSSGVVEASAEQSGAEKGAPAQPVQPEERQQKLVTVQGGLQLARPQPRRHNPAWPRRTQAKPAKPRPKPNVTDWRLYLIQEYCDGGTLRQAVDEGKLFRHGGSERGPQTPSAGNSAALPLIPTAEAMRFAGAPIATRAAGPTPAAAAAAELGPPPVTAPPTGVARAGSFLEQVQGRAQGRGGASPAGAASIDTGAGPGEVDADARADKPIGRLLSYLRPDASRAALMVVGDADADGAAGSGVVNNSDGNHDAKLGNAAHEAHDAAAAATSGMDDRAGVAAPGSPATRRAPVSRPRLQTSITCESAASLGALTNGSGSNFATLDTAALNTTDSNLTVTAAAGVLMGVSALATATAIEAGTPQQQAATIAPFLADCEPPRTSACRPPAENSACSPQAPAPTSADARAPGPSSSIFEAFVTAAAAHNGGNPDASPPHTAKLPVVSGQDAAPAAPHSLDSGHAALSAANADQPQHTITLTDVPARACRCPSPQGSTERTDPLQIITCANNVLPAPVPPAPAAVAAPAAPQTAAADAAGRGSRSQRPQQPQHEDPQLRQERPLPADLALVVQTALGVASGVAYLHSRNIIHGDLSANNVLLMRTPSPALPVVAKVSDFGLSLRLSDSEDQVMNVRHGTPYYQSPELAEQGTCSLAADVYSVGVLLWELYHGPPPWRTRRNNNKNKAGGLAAQQARLLDPAGDLAQARAAAEAGGWDDPHYRLRACEVLKIAPHCPSAYARLVRRCLCPDLRERPTARSVVKALLRMERGIAAAQAVSGAMASASSFINGPPMGALMALSRPRAAPSTLLSAGMARTSRSGLAAGVSHSPFTAGGGGSGPNGACPIEALLGGCGGVGGGGGGGSRLDAALLLEDFDAAAAAVAAAVAAVTARPAAAGAAACAGAAARALAECDDESLIAVGLEPAVVREARQPKPVNLSRRESALPHTGLHRAPSTGSSDLCNPLDADAGAMAAASAAAAAVCGTEPDMHVIRRQPSQHRAAVAAAVAVAKAVASVTSTLSNNISAPAPICASTTLGNALFGRTTTGIPTSETSMAARAGAASATGVSPLRPGGAARLQEPQPQTRSLLLDNSAVSSIVASGAAARGSTTEPTVLVSAAAVAEADARAAGGKPGGAAAGAAPAAAATDGNGNLCVVPRGGRDVGEAIWPMDL
ncbi:hypothetical protein HXX76_008141 [Chlamydomonas incerta]|uniref:Protein kinase domain-containing protein n=1 Tax=Chlamydomonas incerta TaxID=51695 RepID=A0A835W2N4_CHLIN|nr:hypothetical protein HXX76_008141 [Chlamydomonas incerta]|eukprot:KAG2433781.1 hypothetical protein HXX76_008141 [Chlamydomonas incerta]